MRKDGDNLSTRYTECVKRVDRAEARAREASLKVKIWLKRAHDIMKGILYPMPFDSNDLSLYLDHV